MKGDGRPRTGGMLNPVVTSNLERGVALSKFCTTMRWDFQCVGVIAELLEMRGNGQKVPNKALK